MNMIRQHFRFDENDRIKEFQIAEKKRSLHLLVQFLTKTVMPFMEENGHVVTRKKIFSDKVNWFETKSYEWILVKFKNTRSIVRKYGTHLTVYTWRDGKKTAELKDSEADSLRITLVHNEPRFDSDNDDDAVCTAEEKTEESLRNLLTTISEENRGLHGDEYKDVMFNNFQFWGDMEARNPKHYWFALDELSTLSLYLSEHHLQKVAAANPNLKFKIPYNSGGFLTGFGESPRKPGHFYLKVEGHRDKKTEVAFWDILHFGDDVENLFKLFEWLEL